MRIDESITIAASRERVWELIHDPADYAGLLDWVTTFEPCDEDGDPGTGARYEMRVKVGSANVGGLVEIVEYDPQRDIVWTSVTGVEQRGRLRLRTESGEKTRLTMRMSYGAPGWLLGTLAELLSGPQVGASVRRSLEKVKREAEGTERPAPPWAGRPGASAARARERHDSRQVRDGRSDASRQGREDRADRRAVGCLAGRRRARRRGPASRPHDDHR